MNTDKVADMAEALQWLRFTVRDLEVALNYAGSDDHRDVQVCEVNHRAAIRNLEEACALLGMEVIIPALEEKL
jgi:hypothetical protein